MPPVDYQRARDEHPTTAAVWIIDGRPYLPFVVVRDDCIDSDVPWAVATVLLLLIRQRQIQDQTDGSNNTDNSNSRTTTTKLATDLPDPLETETLSRKISVQPFCGGVTNTLYRATVEVDDPDKDGLDQQLLRLACPEANTNPTTTRATTVEQSAAVATATTTATLTSSSSSSSSSIVLLVRIFGAAGMIDRDYEASVFSALSSPSSTAKLSTANGNNAMDTNTGSSIIHTQNQTELAIAPPYYGRFANGRVEGWMPGMRPLQTSELRTGAIATAIATQLARLHVGFDLPPHLYTPPNLFPQLYDWIDRAETHGRPDANTSNNNNSKDGTTSTTINLDLLVQRIRPELQWLHQLVVQNVNESEGTDAIVFCHNDLLAANILVHDDDDEDDDGVENGSNGPSHTATTTQTPETNNNLSIQLIDFEYGGVNYRAFDIANHFNEYAGGPPDCCTPDYTNLPSIPHQRAFIRTYLEAAQRIRAVSQRSPSDCESNLKPSTSNGSRHSPPNTSLTTATITEEQVDAMMSEVELFLLANHLYWGLWAVNQAAAVSLLETVGVDSVYDYETYALSRIEQYWIEKQTIQDRYKNVCVERPMQ